MKERQQLLTKLEKIIIKKGASQVFASMGYESKEALRYWRKIGNVPKMAVLTVTTYIQSQEGEK